MTTDDLSTNRDRLTALNGRLLAWLNESAYPLWARNGIDPANGGFIEALRQDGTPLPHARRARVQPRQIFAFAQAPGLGWSGEAGRVVRRGCDYFIAHYRRPDGLMRTLVGADGQPLDDSAVLYDQAFALLGFAAAAEALDAREEFERHALALRAAIGARLQAEDGAFYSTEGRCAPFESNPHMHLLEACLAWTEIGADAGWKSWAETVVEIALRRFIRPETGALGEFFAADWQPAPGIAGRLIEPGHQFEWAWLLLRASHGRPGPVCDAALRLVSIGEGWGVRDQVAVNALLDDLSVHDQSARFWPQTERLKAALLAAELTGEPRFTSMAADAAASLFPYLDTGVAGLWLDVRLPGGAMVDAIAPASSFYHLIGAIVALNRAVKAW